jgi:hypothetical protein
MKYLKLYKKFFEDGGDGGGATSGSGDGGGVAYAGASISGMGPVVSAQPGLLPGTTGTVGSGDVGRTFKKEKRKKGKPSEVSDLRDLGSADTVNIKESSDVDEDTIKDCLIELYDDGFELLQLDSYSRNHQFDKDDDEVGEFIDKRLDIGLIKNLNDIYTGTLTIKSKFDKSGVTKSDVTTLRPRGKNLSDVEKQYLDTCEDISNKLVNLLDYENGDFTIEFLPGKLVTYTAKNSTTIYTNLKIHFNLSKVKVIK